MLVILAAVGIGDENIRQEVVCAETGFSRAAEAKDAGKFLSYVDPDARFITGRVSRGREEIGQARIEGEAIGYYTGSPDHSITVGMDGREMTGLDVVVGQE